MSDKDLTGQDLDAAVAVDVMHHQRPLGKGLVPCPDGRRGCAVAHYGLFDSQGIRVPGYSSDWSAMRLVIDEMARRGWDVQMSVHGPRSRAYFLRPAGTDMDVFAAFECHDAENAILPTAVCRAALAAVRAGKDGGA